MADQFKQFSGYMPSTNSIDQYTVPSGKGFVLKSLVVTNNSDSDLTFNVTGAVAIAATKLIKSKQTLIIPVADIFYRANENLRVYASAASLVSYFLSGVEFDDPGSFNYEGFTRLGAQYLNSSNTTIVSGVSTPRLMKTIVLCNLTGVTQTINLFISGTAFIASYKLAPADTLFIPNLDQILPASATVTGTSTNNSSVFAFVCGKAVI